MIWDIKSLESIHHESIVREKNWPSPPYHQITSFCVKLFFRPKIWPLCVKQTRLSTVSTKTWAAKNGTSTNEINQLGVTAIFFLIF